jgi:flagellar motor switch protein FliN/FliY
MDQNTSILAAWLTEQFGESLRQTIEAMVGESPSVRAAAATTDLLKQPLFWWEQTFSLGSEVKLWVGASDALKVEIGQRALQAAGITDAEPEDIHGTYLEILNQATSALARATTSRMAQEVNVSSSREAAPQESCVTAALEISSASGGSAIVLGISQQLLQAVAGVSQLPGPASPAAGGTHAPESALAATSLAPSKTLDVLLGVELPVSVSFGRTQMLLKDVLKLSTGSIVELNRSIAEPVEVIVNNCTIARGEVVVVEGNYGIRIQEIVSRQERLISIS